MTCDADTCGMFLNRKLLIYRILVRIDADFCNYISCKFTLNTLAAVNQSICITELTPTSNHREKAGKGRKKKG